MSKADNLMFTFESDASKKTNIEAVASIFKKPGFRLFLMSVPFLVVILLFYYLPLLGWSIAFIDYQPGISILKSRFTGFKSFEEVLTIGGNLYLVLRNTLVMSLLGIIFSPTPIVFALMLSEVRSKRFSKIVQTVTSFPNFISWILVYAIVYSVIAQSDSVFNTILLKFNIIKTPVNILSNPDMVWPFQLILQLWKNTGWQAIIYIATIAGIDSELYAAAEVDGAGRFRKILHITIPGVMGTYIVLLMLQISNMLSNGFEQYYVFHGPMVHEKIAVLDYYLYQTGLGEGNFSFSTAMGIFKTLISIILLFSVNGISKKIRGESIV